MTAWIVSGIVAGALAGVVDVGIAIAGGIGGLSVVKALRLLVLASGVLAVVGGGVGLVAAAVASWVRRRGWSRRWLAAAVAAIAAPLAVRDAFALFAGPSAAKIPGHHLISIALALAAVAGCYALARVLDRLLARERPPRAWIAALAVLAVACGFGNRFVLPRLYPWFHQTLSIVTFTSLLVAVRLGRRPGDAPAPARVAAFAGIAVLALGFAVLELARSQVMRYLAHERTAVASLALRALPARLQPHAAPAPVRAARAEEPDLPPLPPGPRRPQADVLLITVDALRADHVGAYGYARKTTPHIDALAASGVRFERAYAQAPHTSFSVASMLTGKYFATLARLAPGERHDPVAAVLRTYGWKTAAFYPPAVFFVDAHKLRAYADTHFDFEYVKFEYIDAERRVDQVLTYYRTVKPQRSFVWIHFFEPHEPYVTHEGFALGKGDVDRYDSEIAYTDAAIGRLVTTVRAQRPGTIIVLAADHGEEFDEHGGRYHGSTLYDEQVRIPLLISIPGVSPRVVGGQVQLIDVTPTLLGLLDIPVPVRMRGTDLGPWLATATPPAPASRLPPAFAEVEDKRMVVFGSEKLLCDLHWGFCEWFDLAADPRERRNQAEERPDRAGAMRARLDDWLDLHVRFEPLLAKGASNPEGGPVPRAIERGRLGDLLAARDLAVLAIGDAPLSQRREAVQLVVSLPARAETAEALGRAVSDPDRVVADGAAVAAARLGDVAVRPRVQALVANESLDAKLRVQAALALAMAGDGSGLSVLAGALDQCEDVLLCRLIITTLGKLGDRRAVRVLIDHLGEVQNRREMVIALGDIGSDVAIEPLLERLDEDDYVPVRMEAAQALLKIGKKAAGKPGEPARLAALIERASRGEREPGVQAAAKEAARALRALRPAGEEE
jgi:arylsulfatase A-like enzyme/HEAT repeat protein